MFLLNEKSVSNRSSYGADFSGGLAGSGGGIQPGVLLAVGIIALIVAILVFIFVVQRKKEFKGKFANWVREYLNFRSILIAGIIKILYMFLAVFLTIMSIIVMFQGKGDEVLPMVLTGLAMLIFGNILLRIMMELTMALIVVWENTSDIRLILVKRDELFGKDGLKEMKKDASQQPETKKETTKIPVETQQPEIIQPEMPQPEVPRPEEAQGLQSHEASNASELPPQPEAK